MKRVRHVRLKKADRQYLGRLLKRGEVRARVFRRATALVLLDREKTIEEVALTLDVSRQAVSMWRDSYQEEGLAFLEDKPRSGRPPKIDGNERAKITALACSEAPEGHARWSLRLLADKAVELGLLEEVSYMQVSRILKKTS